MAFQVAAGARHGGAAGAAAPSAVARRRHSPRQTATLRLLRELRMVKGSPVAGVAAAPLDDNLFEWHCSLAAPQPLRGERRVATGVLHCVLRFPDNYPALPPAIELLEHVPSDHVIHGGMRRGADVWAVCGDTFERVHPDDARPWAGWSSACDVLSLLLQVRVAVFDAPLAPRDGPIVVGRVACVTCGCGPDVALPPLPTKAELARPAVGWTTMRLTGQVTPRQLTQKPHASTGKGGGGGGGTASSTASGGATALTTACARLNDDSGEWQTVRRLPGRTKPPRGTTSQSKHDDRSVLGPETNYWDPLSLDSAAVPGKPQQQSRVQPMKKPHVSPQGPRRGSGSVSSFGSDSSPTTPVTWLPSNKPLPGQVSKSAARRARRRAAAKQPVAAQQPVAETTVVATTIGTPTPSVTTKSQKVASGAPVRPKLVVIHVDDQLVRRGPASATAPVGPGSAAVAAVGAARDSSSVSVVEAVEEDSADTPVWQKLANEHFGEGFFDHVDTTAAANGGAGGRSYAVVDQASAVGRNEPLPPEAKRVAGGFARTGYRVLFQMLQLLSAADVAAVSGTCRWLNRACEDGRLWRLLFQRSYPRSSLTPETMTGWKRALALEANHAAHASVCYYTKATADEDVLGVPITYTVNPRTNEIDYMHSSMELLSRSAYNDSRVRRTAWNESFDAWLPMYINEAHFQRALPHIRSSIMALCSYTRDSYVWDPEAVLDVLPRLMNTMVVLISDNGIARSSAAIDGYCQLHRLFIALCKAYPRLLVAVRRTVRQFMRDPRQRRKKHTPSLGNFLPLLSVCEGLDWSAIAPALVAESIDRSVIWVCKQHPELARVPKTPPRDATGGAGSGGSSLADLTDEERSRLEKTLEATRVSRNIFVFHVAFLRVLANVSTTPLDRVAARYDMLLGTAPRALKEEFLKLVETATESDDSWPRYFAAVGLRCPEPVRLVRMLEQSVRNSEKFRYHKKGMDFSRVHASGVSNILLRGESYSAMTLVIDTSGSMGMYVDGQSRLQAVAAYIDEVLSDHLNSSQSFNIIEFNSSYSAWRRGVQSATPANVKAAAAYVRSWTPTGGTNMLAPLREAFNDRKVRAVVLLSDGEPWDDHEELVHSVERWSTQFGRRIPLHTTAFLAPQGGVNLMARLANVTGGKFVQVGESEY